MKRFDGHRNSLARLALAALVSVALLSTAPAPVTGNTAAHQVGPASSGVFAEMPASLDADSVLLRVALQPNGDARWTVEYRVRLENENQTAAFESFQSDVADDPASYRTEFASRMNATVKSAENATGRSMTAANYSVGTDVRQLPQTYGVVTYSFDWHGFAAPVGGNTYRVGDALNGLFLDEETTLQFTWPDGYSLTDVSPAPTDAQTRSVSWTGTMNFAENEPRATLAPAAAGTTTSTTDAATPTDTTAGPPTTTSEAGDGMPSWMLGVGMLVLVSMAVVGLWYANQQRSPPPSEVSAESTPPEPLDGASPETSADDTLLSNEERVLRLLERSGGRIKQQEVVEELGWSEAKTSQVVGTLRDNDEITVFRLGRENVLRLPDTEEP